MRRFGWVWGSLWARWVNLRTPCLVSKAESLKKTCKKIRVPLLFSRQPVRALPLCHLHVPAPSGPTPATALRMRRVPPALPGPASRGRQLHTARGARCVLLRGFWCFVFFFLLPQIVLFINFFFPPLQTQVQGVWATFVPRWRLPRCVRSPARGKSPPGGLNQGGEKRKGERQLLKALLSKRYRRFRAVLAAGPCLNLPKKSATEPSAPLR